MNLSVRVRSRLGGNYDLRARGSARAGPQRYRIGILTCFHSLRCAQSDTALAPKRERRHTDRSRVSVTARVSRGNGVTRQPRTLPRPVSECCVDSLSRGAGVVRKEQRLLLQTDDLRHASSSHKGRSGERLERPCCSNGSVAKVLSALGRLAGTRYQEPGI